MKKLLLFATLFSCLNAAPIDDLKKSVSSEVNTLYGWCTEEKASSFIDLILKVKPSVCVEIGVFGGRSIMPVASALKFLGHGIVVGIDPWDKEESIRHFDPEKDQDHIQWWSKISFDQVYNSYINMIAYYKLDEQIITIRATSEHAAKILGTIDILYIDGNHQEAASLNEVTLYLPKVRSGGYIWLNDSLSLDTQASVDLLLETCEFIELIDEGNCILFRKK